MAPREEIIQTIENYCWWLDTDEMTKEELRQDIMEDLMPKLHSQGVVRRVKCPDCVWNQFGGEAVGMTPCYRCNSMGYIIEPLIGEE